MTNEDSSKAVDEQQNDEQEVVDCDSVIAKSIQAVADDDSYIMTLTLEEFAEVELDRQLNQRVDKLGVQIFATLFEHVFQDDPFETIDEDSFNLYLAIDKDVFYDEVQQTIEEMGIPVKIQLDESDIDPNDRTRFVPEVNVADDVEFDSDQLRDDKDES